MLMLRNVQLLILLVCVVGVAPVHADRVRIPGTKVSIDSPQSFALSSRFAGMENVEKGASIMVTEIPAAVDHTTAGFTEENLEARGMQLLSSEDVMVGEQKGMLYGLKQQARGIMFEKWMVALGDARTSILVVATYPEAFSEELKSTMRTALLSASWDPGIVTGQFEGLSYRISETDELKIQHRMQNMLLLSAPGSSRGPETPLIVVGSSFSQQQISNIEDFSRLRIDQTQKITDVSAIEGVDKTVDGRPAYELTARAKDKQSGTPVAVYQLIVVDGQTYYIAQGLVGESSREQYLPQFRAVAESITIQ